MKLAQRIEALTPSITLAITAKAKQMQANGIDVIGFGAGEPDFDTPQNIKAAAIEAIQNGFTRYTPSEGIKDLKEAVCRKLKKDQGLEYHPNQIVITCGAKHALYNIFQAICNPGDEVIVPSPYWVSYTEQIKLAGGIPVIVETREEDGFKLSAGDLEANITPRTRAVIINSPNNPTGTVYSRKELSELGKILEGKDIYIISDEIYEKLVYDNVEHVSIASLSEQLKRQTVIVNGVSKAYAMTGWRIGFSASEPDLAKAMGDLQSHTTSNATSIAQKASVEAYNGSQEILEVMNAEFVKRRDYIVERLNNMPGIYCRKPEGAFYAFANIKGLFGKEINGKKITDSLSCADILLEEAKIAVVPGIGFGAEGYIRFSYATSMDLIKEGMDRLERVLR